MNIKAAAINSFAQFMLGGETFKKIRHTVTALNARNLSGEQKRQIALEDIQAIAGDLAGWAINLGIELAVAYLKSLAK